MLKDFGVKKKVKGANQDLKIAYPIGTIFLTFKGEKERDTVTGTVLCAKTDIQMNLEEIQCQ